MTLTLPEWLAGLVFTILLVLVRVGAAFLALPGLGSVVIPTRIRLLLALGFALTLAPILATRLPGLPPSPAALVILILMETLVGLFIGTIAKMLLAAIETAGTIIAQSTGLANAFLLNPAMGAQTSLPGALLGQASLVLLFVTDLHHLLLRALFDSYMLFPPGQAPMLGDMADTVTRVLAGSFVIGLQLAAPFLVAMVLFFLALGLINRLMPQIQVFFIATPLQLILGILLFGLVIGVILRGWARYFDESMMRFLIPP